MKEPRVYEVYIDSVVIQVIACSKKEALAKIETQKIPFDIRKLLIRRALCNENR